MSIPQNDVTILQRLAQEIAAIAALPIQKEKIQLWKRLNQLESVRPLVRILPLHQQTPWHEMNVDDELTLQTVDSWARNVEWSFRMTLYQWRHFPGDMVVNPYLSCPLAIRSTGLGIDESTDIVKSDENNAVVSRHFHVQISKPEDIEKIKMPVVTHDVAATEENYDRMTRIFGDIMPVRKEGLNTLWFAPWDLLVRLWGVQELMLDLIERPEMVEAIYSRFVEACLYELDQYEALNVLSLGQDPAGPGSGGYGYTDELPGKDYDPGCVRAHNLWGCSAAQVFSEVSPEMHWEFSLKLDMPWLKRWGLNYYGCCEPLDRKIDILRRIPNLRKISMSPWVDPERGARQIGTDYVFSYKPNPAYLAEDRWRPDAVRNNLRSVLEKARGCHVEVILKDISTCRYDPRRIWEWEKIAMELVEGL